MTFVFDFANIVLIVTTFFLVYNVIGFVRSQRKIKEMKNRLQVMIEIQWCLELGLYETVDFKAAGNSDIKKYVTIMKI